MPDEQTQHEKRKASALAFVAMARRCIDSAEREFAADRRELGAWDCQRAIENLCHAMTSAIRMEDRVTPPKAAGAPSGSEPTGGAS